MKVTSLQLNNGQNTGAWHHRGWLLLAALIVVIAGLSLRYFGYQAGLPFIIVKYGGSLLWGAMVYLLVAVLLVAKAQYQIILTAEFLAIMVELSRLIHTPWLDGFRETAAGALLLGKVFSLWNILAYTLGIGLAALINQACKRR